MLRLSPEEFAQRYGSDALEALPSVPTNAAPGYFERVGSGISNSLSDIPAAMKDAATNPTLRSEVGSALRITKAATNAAVTPIAEAPGIKQVGELFGLAGDQVSDLLMKNPGYSKAFETLAAFLDANPEIGDAINTASNVAGFVGSGRVGTTAARGTSRIAGNTADAAVSFGSDLKGRVQSTIAKQNVHPQLQQSASRLADQDPFFMQGAQRLADPLAAYDEFLDASKKALTDIKSDPAVSIVGERIGDSFNAVVKQRRAVGAVMGEELKKVAGLRLGILENKGRTMSELKESGLSYNPRTRQLTSFQGNRFAPAEVKMLQEYVDRLQALGDTPTVGDIDNFIAKSRSVLQFLKGESGVIGTTNAERIIQQSITDLKGSLDPARNGISALKGYWDANRTYSDLSDFVEEGSGFLGKTTQAGDFAKDASLAKSAVQSILNNGKKDWLAKLEALTGYPALDESVLALQAMKDAGDFRGLSLLQQLSEGSLPTSKAGFVGKITELALDKAGDIFLGPAEERTRAFLRSLLREAEPRP